jgi:hypothetical protein
LEQGLHNTYCCIKKAVIRVSKEQLLQNRKDHVAACRADPDYCGDINKFMKNGKEYQIDVGGIVSDGAGSVWAYNHLITRMQHALIVFSLQTGKPLWVNINQILCLWGQRKVTKVLQTSLKKACDMNNIDPSHDGQCYQNSKYTPTQAEEYACEAAGQFFLFDEATNDFKAWDEAFFVANIIWTPTKPAPVWGFTFHSEWV